MDQRRIIGVAVASLLALSLAFADDSTWEVTVDRGFVGMDESVSLQFSIQSDGNFQIGEPHFDAPDFDEVNQYSSVFVESYYQNGQFGVRNNKKVTKVLRPKKTGRLQISQIRVDVNGKQLQHPPLSVEVTASGQGTPPPARYGGGGMGLRGMKKNVSGPPFTVRAELDRSRVYKGQQVIVSYYLYRRSRVFNIQVEKYPILDGFLREDLELPVLGQRVQDESVVVDGVPYERSLLARYAAYPLKEGRLPVDSMAIKANYYPGTDAGIDLNDPIQSFFQQIQPREWSHRNDRLELEVLPLPTEGRPTSFTGGVGDFSLDSAVDRTQVRANEALTLTLKVEGMGNVAAITEPKVAWPADVEIFETKSKVLSSRGGVSTKVFEVLIIPRKPGKLTLPQAEFSFFSVKNRAYRTLTAAGHSIDVLEPSSFNGVAVSGAGVSSSGVQPSVAPSPLVPVYLLPEEWKGAAAETVSARKIARWILAALLGVSGILLVASLGRRIVRKWQKLRSLRLSIWKKNAARSSDELRRFAKSEVASAPWEQVLRAYDQLAQCLCQRIDDKHLSKFMISARALSREEIYKKAVEDLGLEPSEWRRICEILEYCEWVRFGTNAGVLTESEARAKLLGLLDEIDRIGATQ
ncbi:MAG: BatD family protein [Oligoflexia bacterium]